MAIGTYTIQNVIDEGLQLLGVLAPGQALNSAQYADCQRTLAWIEDEWNAQETLVPNLVSPLFSLVANRPGYAIGFAAVPPDFVGYRPQRLLQASLYQSSGSTTARTPLA